MTYYVAVLGRRDANGRRTGKILASKDGETCIPAQRCAGISARAVSAVLMRRRPARGRVATKFPGAVSAAPGSPAAVMVPLLSKRKYHHDKTEGKISRLR
jgi:hypothetical protein